MSSNETHIRNETGRRIQLRASDGGKWLLLAPLEERKFEDGQKAELDLRRWLEFNAVSLRLEKKEPGLNENLLTAVGSGIVAFLFFGFILGTSKEIDMSRVVLTLGTLSITILGLYFIIGLTVSALVVIGVLWGSTTKKTIILRIMAQGLSLLTILLVAVGLPFLGVYKFGGDLFAGPPLAMMGRWIQLVFITVAAALPALLYFLFDRQQLGTLQEKFWRDILRLDPYVKTLADVRAKYGKQINEIYGSDRERSGAGRLLADSRWPITVATVVITVGWFLALLPASGRGEISQPSELFELITPQRTAIAFGFLGAYFYGLNMVLRRYVLGDLRPKAYSSLTVRILVVFILAWVLPEVVPASIVLPLAFLAGIIPETLMTYFEEKLRNQRWPRLGRKRKGKPEEKLPPLELKERQPLTKLEGIDLYDRSRLMDEGVTSIENLAHHDLVDLILQTRIPTQRLVDWVDQAILYLHLGGDEQADKVMTSLRRYGIRTATGFQRACQFRENYSLLLGALREAVASAPGDGNGHLGKGVGSAPTPECEHVPRRLRVILEMLEEAEWLDYIRHWRTYRLYANLIVKDPMEIYKQESPARLKAQLLPDAFDVLSRLNQEGAKA